MDVVRVFTCNNCGQLVFFENTTCLRCMSPLGYSSARADLVALTDVGNGRLVDLTGPIRSWSRCANYDLIGCNWLVEAGGDQLCASCALTRTRPADEDTDAMAEFANAERQKRRLIYQLGQLRLPVQPRDAESERGLAFDLLSSEEVKVITGHDNGVITLDLAEADDEHRERLKRQLNEPYRTLLGHFRHEIGHYYWPVLVTDTDLLAACRSLFGDDRADYALAVKQHYSADESKASEWTKSYISHYATMHPYEDWAESFAHYLHILDALQTAENFHLGAASNPALPPTSSPTRPYGADTFGQVIDRWLELTYGLNQVNRSMGRPDLYPFVLTATVVRKLAFIDRVVEHWRTAHGS